MGDDDLMMWQCYLRWSLFRNLQLHLFEFTNESIVFLCLAASLNPLTNIINLPLLDFKQYGNELSISLQNAEIESTWAVINKNDIKSPESCVLRKYSRPP